MKCEKCPKLSTCPIFAVHIFNDKHNPKGLMSALKARRIRENIIVRDRELLEKLGDK